MSDFTENKWAAISERGREAADLTYEEARRLVHRLAAEGRHGLCIITNQAASHLASAPSQPETSGISNTVS